MKTITLRIEDEINDSFMEMLKRFSDEKLRILDWSEHKNNDEYLRSFEETNYLLRSPKNAQRLRESIAELESGGGTEQELLESRV
jgi:hypothetical protein